LSRRDGRERWNHLNALPIKQIHDRWISQYAGHAISIIDRLKSDLEARVIVAALVMRPVRGAAGRIEPIYL
jgi:hypothetical protein